MGILAVHNIHTEDFTVLGFHGFHLLGSDTAVKGFCFFRYFFHIV